MNSLRVVRPRRRRADVEVAGLAVIVVEAIGERALEVGGASGLIPAAADRVILLPALAAERQGEQDLRALAAGDKLLRLERRVPHALRLRRSVDRLALREELVQAEGEQGGGRSRRGSR